MEDKIFEIIKGWAGIPTWHTGHPLDQERFSKVMRNLIFELGVYIDIEDFENALRRHAENNSSMLGDPRHWDELITKYTIKAETILTYEKFK